MSTFYTMTLSGTVGAGGAANVTTQLIHSSVILTITCTKIFLNFELLYQ